MKILILGGEGMLGHKVFQVFEMNFDTWATFQYPHGLWNNYPIYQKTDRKRLIPNVDAMNFSTVIHAFGLAKPGVVINCIGIVKQLEEAKNPIISIQLNSLFPHRLAELCAATGTRLIHMSTDCVFSGRQGNYRETDIPDPQDLYGWTKLIGETTQPHCLTLRTSIFGRDYAKKSALLEWFLSRQGMKIKGYKRAIYTGFPTQVLARIMVDIIKNYPNLSGLYHIASEPISKYELLTRIKDAMNMDIEIEPDDEFICDRSLNPARFLEATGYKIPSWKEMILDLKKDLLGDQVKARQ